MVYHLSVASKLLEMCFNILVEKKQKRPLSVHSHSLCHSPTHLHKLINEQTKITCSFCHFSLQWHTSSHTEQMHKGQDVFGLFLSFFSSGRQQSVTFTASAMVGDWDCRWETSDVFLRRLSHHIAGNRALRSSPAAAPSRSGVKVNNRFSNNGDCVCPVALNSWFIFRNSSR